MPAWRLGRFIGSLLVLAVLAVGGYAAYAGPVQLLQRPYHAVVADSDAPTPDVPVTDPATDYDSSGWEWD